MSAPAASAKPKEGSLFERWVLGGIAACCGEAATFPLDFTKTRLQLQNELGRSLGGGTAAPAAASGAMAAAVGAKPPPAALGMFATFAHIVRTEGLLAMYGGLGAAAGRQFVYGGIGVGLYVPVRRLVIGDVDPASAPLWKRMAAGALSGSGGCGSARPLWTDQRQNEPFLAPH